MKIKWSGFGATDGRGKINGHVAAKNRSGAYARTKVTPTNPQTSFQLAIRSMLTFFSQAWRGLSAAQIAAWNGAAPGFGKSNVFGDKVNPTGKNLYTALNTNLQMAGAAAINTPPSPEGAEQVVAGALSIASAGAKTIAHSGTTAASRLMVSATAPQSPGVRFLKGKYRQITDVAGNAASPLDIAAAYTAKFGTPPVGSYVGVQLKAINLTTGEVSLVSEAATIVT